jgi:predicted HicB family RNase H-like nuclease
MKKAEKILAAAKTAASSCETWADLSNALFDPEEGLVAKAYPTRAERERFLKSKEYQSIRQLIDAAAERTGLVEGATPKKSGKFVVRLPRSLHAALEAEAREEGVSLNQLVVTKLAMQMARLVATGARELVETGR